MMPDNGITVRLGQNISFWNSMSVSTRDLITPSPHGAPPIKKTLQERITRKWSRAVAPVAFGGCCICFFLAPWAVLLGTGFQVLVWLRDGAWVQLPAASFGLAKLAEWSDNGVLKSWAVLPETWVGLHRFLDWFSVGTALALVFFFMFVVLLTVSSHAEKKAQEIDCAWQQRIEIQNAAPTPRTHSPSFTNKSG